MKHIQLAAIGNALVDVEYKVSNEEFDKLGKTKGSMSLTDTAGQEQIIKTLGERNSNRCSGGSAANTIIAYGQFGGSAAYMSVLGDDTFGTFYASEFTQLGLTLEANMIPGASTGTCLVLITPDSERTMNTALGINTTYSRHNLNDNVIAGSEWLYLEGYKLTEESGADALEVAAFTAKKHGTHVAVTCSDGFIINVFGDRLRRILTSADLVFCNETEAMALSQEGTVEDAIRSLQSTYKNVVVTRGADGSTIQCNGDRALVPAYAVTPVDATGAGDMFAGAFLYGMINRYSSEQAGRLASYAAAKVVAQYGARLKTNHIEIRDQILLTAPTV